MLYTLIAGINLFRIKNTIVDFSVCLVTAYLPLYLFRAWLGDPILAAVPVLRMPGDRTLAAVPVSCMLGDRILAAVPVQCVLGDCSLAVIPVPRMLGDCTLA